MQSVLISIQPKWCELIALGKKKVEVRKTKPKLETPFKVYIYCTSGKEKLWVLRASERKYAPEKVASIFAAKDVGGAYQANGKVIGEFVCDKVFGLGIKISKTEILPEYSFSCACLTNKEIMEYLGNDRGGYAWHISDLKIYEKPRKLGEFVKYRGDWGSRAAIGALTGLDCNEYLKRPPQSWMYVEEI